MTSSEDQHEAIQTIEDVPTASIILTPPLPPSSSNKRMPVIVALVIVLAGVLFFLPRINPAIDFPTDTDKVDQGSTSSKVPRTERISPLSDAEALVFRREAQDLLVEIVDLKNSLLEQNVQTWAAAEFDSITSDLATAESQYQSGEYALAKRDYADVRSQFHALRDSFQPRLEELLKEAEAAIADYRAADALELFQLVLAMEPPNARGNDGAALASVLPEIQLEMTDAINCRSRQDLNCALRHTQQALSLNVGFIPARALNDALSTELVQQRYQAKMSQGFLALEQQRWDSARKAFGEAQSILPEQSNTALAFAQTDAAQEQIEVTQLLDKARALESQEEWDRAQKIYEKLLRRDASLVEPTVRLIVVRARAKIAAQYRRYLADPMLLTRSRDAVQAEQLLQDTAALALKSPLLADQHKLLSKHLSIMKTPKQIAFTSNGQTEVTVFKVAKLGRFNETTLTLKPGKYIASGNRQGYRDVRVEFVVRGDSAVPLVSIACVDLI